MIELVIYLWLVLGVFDYWRTRVNDLRLNRDGSPGRFRSFHPLDVVLSLIIGPIRQMEGPLTVILASYDGYRSMWRRRQP